MPRLLILACLATAPVAGQTPIGPMTQASAPRVTSLDSARHALDRLAWGGRPGEAAAIARQGVMAWIDGQLAVAGTDAPDAASPGLDRPSLTTSTADMVRLLRAGRSAGTGDGADSAGGAQRVTRPSPGAPTIRRLLTDYSELTLERQVTSDAQLAEVLADFWFNHFNVSITKGLDRALLRDYVETTIRPHIFDRFEELLVATAESPAMLYYLDNWRSTARDGVNENYGRELMELHTLGVDGGYTQADVVAVARILTGWTFDRRTLAFRFADRNHDTGSVVALGVKFSGKDGASSGRRLLHLLATHPSTIQHISTELCARLVADTPPTGCIEVASRAWRASDGNLRDVVAAIVHCDAFWATEAIGSKTKSPQEYLVSALRAVGAQLQPLPTLPLELAQLGQPLFRQVAPTGWPESAEDWVSSSALLARMNLAIRLASGRLRGVTVDLDRLVPIEPDHQRLIDNLNRVLLAGAMRPATRAAILDQLATLTDAKLARQTAVALVLGGPDFQRQ